MSDETFLDFWSKIPRHEPIEEEQSFLEWVDVGPRLLFSDQEPLQEETHTLKQKKKNEKNESRVRLTKEEIKKADEKHSRKVIEYENWLGRIVDLKADSIGARITNTLNRFSPRFVRIERSFFIAKGISQELFYGDEFELSYQRVRLEKGQVKNEERIRMIQHVRLDDNEIKRYVDEQLRELNILLDDTASE